MPARFTATNDGDVTRQTLPSAMSTLMGETSANLNQHEPKANTAKVRVGGTTPAAIRVGPVVCPARQSLRSLVALQAMGRWTRRAPRKSMP